MRFAFYARRTQKDLISVEVQWMWLPTFIGQNIALMRELEIELRKEFTGKETTDETLDAIHERVVAWLDKKLHIPGLKEYLEAVKNVQE